MPEMKDSGIEWIGEIPKEWDVIRIKDKYTFNTGFTPDTEHSEYYTDEYGFEWATIADVKNGRVVSPTKSTISREYVKNNHKKQMPAGCLLYSFKLSVGETAITDRPLFTNEAIACFYPSKDVNINFFKYSSFLIEHNANTNIYGAKILNQQLINNAYVVFPSLEVQQSIADFLDQKCFEIDSLSANIQSQIDILEDYKKSVITETVTKGLNPDVEMKDSGIEWIGMIPKHWNCMRLKHCLDENTIKMRVGPFGSALSGSDIQESGYWVYNQRCVLDKNFNINDTCINEEKFNELKSFEVFENDVLITTRGTIGKVAVVPKNAPKGVLHPCIIKFIPNKKIINSRLIEYIFNNSDIVLNQILHKSNSTTIEVIYSYSLKEVYFPIMPLSEQLQIVEYLDKKCVEIDTIIVDKKTQLETLAEYKKSLIYEYVTGKKEVPNNE